MIYAFVYHDIFVNLHKNKNGRAPIDKGSEEIMKLELTARELLRTEMVITADMRKKWRDCLKVGDSEFWSKEIDVLADIKLKIENNWTI